MAFGDWLGKAAENVWSFLQQPLLWWVGTGFVGIGLVAFLLQPRLKVRVEAQQEKTPDANGTGRDMSAVFTLTKTRLWRGSNSFGIVGDFWAEGTDEPAAERLKIGLTKDGTKLLASAIGPQGLAAPDAVQVLRRPRNMPLYIPYRFFFDWVDEGPSHVEDETGEPLHNWQAYGRPGFLRLFYEINGREKSLLLKFYADPAKEFSAVAYDDDGAPTDFEWDGDASSIRQVHWWHIVDRCNFWLVRHGQPMKTRWADWKMFKRMAKRGRW